MASKNPLGKAAGAAISSLRHPVDTTSKVVGQAKGTAALGRMVTERVGRTAAAVATETVSAVRNRATGRRSVPAGPLTRPRTDPATGSPTGAVAPQTSSRRAPESRLTPPTPLRPVPEVNEPAHTVEQATFPVPAPARQSASRQPGKKAAGRRPAKKAAAKAPAKAPAKKASATKAPAKKAPAKQTPAKRSGAKKSTAQTSTAKKSTARKSTARKSTAKKSTARKSTAKKSTAKKSTAKKSTAKKSARKSTKQVSATPADVAAVIDSGTGPEEPQEIGVTTPAGTTRAAAGVNPDTAEADLDQPGTEGIVEPSTAKQVASESNRLRKAAERDPG